MKQSINRKTRKYKYHLNNKKVVVENISPCRVVLPCR